MAVSVLFLVGVAALAVDVSGFYEDARFEQTAADMTCLAGVRDLPQDPASALTNAVEVAKANWTALAPFSPTTTATQAVLSDGNGNSVTITAGYGGDPAKMAVTVSQAADTSFSRIFGADSAQVTQEAYCKVWGLQLGDLPFGALPGGFDGILQVDNPCNTGNCRPIELPRDDASGSGVWFIRNIALGADRELFPVKAGVDPALLTVCAVGAGPCTIVDQDQGVSAGQLSDGLARGSGAAGVQGRLQNLAGATRTFVSLGGRSLNGDYLPQVLDPTPGPAMAFPDFDGIENPVGQPVPTTWDSDVHGVWNAVDMTKHVTYNATIGKCDSPRFARIPIIAQVDWDPSQPVNLPGGNSDPVKVVGFYMIVLEKPLQGGDFKNPSDTIKTLTARAVWFGPDANCVGPGGEVKPYEPGDAKVLRLVDQNG